MIDPKLLKGLKVRIKPKLQFDDDIIGEIVASSADFAGEITVISVKIDGGSINNYMFPQCFKIQMRFLEEEKVPLDIRKEILKRLKEKNWKIILAKYRDDESKINFTDELRNLNLDMNRVGMVNYVRLRYKEIVGTTYNNIINNTSADADDQKLIDELESAILKFNSQIVFEAKELLYNKVINESDFINGEGQYRLSDNVNDYILNVVDSSEIDEIIEKKKAELSNIRREFFDNVYVEGFYRDVVKRLKMSCEQITKKYAHKANVREYYPILLEHIETSARRFPQDHPHGFEGPVHITNTCNAIDIFNGGLFKSRKALEAEGRVFEDVAMEGAMSVTDDWVKECSRFYYAFNTPTHYRAKYTDPVGLVFDPEIMTWDNAIFLFQSAADSHGVIQFSIEEATKFEWDKVFYRGRYNPRDPVNWDMSKQRNREFLIKGNVPTKYIKKIYFPSKRVLKNVNEALQGKIAGIEQEINFEMFGFRYMEFDPSRLNLKGLP